MNSEQLKELISGGESSTLEFKRKATTPEKIAKEVSALANTKGGYILFGVDDNSYIIGIDSEKGEMDLLSQACNFFVDPPIHFSVEVIVLYGQYVLVAEIPESETKPHTVEIIDKETSKKVRRAYIRMGEKSVVASSEMYRFLKRANSDEGVNIVIGGKEKSLLDYLSKYERATVKDFMKLVNISRRRAERLMIRLVRAGVLQINNDNHRDYFTLR